MKGTILENHLLDASKPGKNRSLGYSRYAYQELAFRACHILQHEKCRLD